jgi:outer membrane protein insertion porin family/translocation and assembly module TamA
MRRIRLVLFLLAVSVGVSACQEDGTVVVHSLTFRGVESVDVALLKSVLATREDTKIPLVGIRLPWSKSKNYFDRTRFDADLQRIQAFYADRGFPDARVASFDVQLNKKQDAVDVVLTIAEGEPVRVVAVDFVGFESLPPRRLAFLRRRLPLAIGKPRDRQAVVAAHESALNELRDHGYPYARVLTEEDDGPGGKEAHVTFTAQPGVLAHFGTIEIAGNKSVGDDVILRQLTIKPGDVYRRSRVQDTQRRLYAMELFQFVNVEAIDETAQSPDIAMRVTVAEGRHQRVNGGIGYGTEEKARIDGEYRHVNFLGGARAFGTHARWSSQDRGVRADFNQPYVFTPKLSFGAEGQRWYTYTPAYNSIVTGAKLSLTHRQSARTSWTVSATSERNISTISPDILGNPDLYNKLYKDLIALGLDATTGKQEGTLSAVGVDFLHSTTDNALNARRGYQISLHAEEAGGVLPGTFNYYSVSADGRSYVPLSRDLVIANRVQFGDIRAANDDPAEVPFSKKYFLGGATSLRGWGRFEVSPLGTSGLPIGGNSLLAASSELRARLKGSFGGVLFIDAGNVWANEQAIDVGDLRVSVGTGLRYQTPIGPLRFDIGYQLNPIDGLLVEGEPQARRWRIHFSIGQAF